MWVTHRLPAIVLFLFALFYLYAGWTLPAFSNQVPGPGFLPRILVIALCVLSISIWLTGKATSRPKDSSEKSSEREPILIIIFLLAYSFAMPLLGFPIATMILVFGMRRTMEPRRWWVDFLGSIVSIVVVQVVFAFLLDLQLPNLPIWMER